VRQPVTIIVLNCIFGVVGVVGTSGSLGIIL
jgi:hypothetical protein